MSTTVRDLYRRTGLLVALVAAATGALFCSYRGVHADAVPLASSTASGVLELDTAKYALSQAQSSAGQDAASDAAGTSDFRTQISVANQSLALAASDDVTGPTGRRTLQTVTGLISSYEGWVELAAQVPGTSVLHAAYMHDARAVLGGSAAGIEDPSVMGRINQLQHEQLKVVDRQTSFGWPLWLGWSAAVVLGLALVAALFEAQGFLRLRFRRRWNRWLAGAVLVTAVGTVLLADFTRRTHNGLFHARATLHRSLSGDAIISAKSSVAGQMADTGLRAAVTNWIAAGGVVVLILILAGLWPRINEYRLRASR